MTDEPIVWITGEAPDAAAGGGGLRQEGLLLALAQHRHVELVTIGGPASAAVAAAVARVTHLDAEAAPSRGARARTAAMAMVRNDVVPEVDADAAVRRAIARAIAADPLLQRAAVSVAIHLPLAPLLPQLPGAPVFHPFHVPSVQLDDEAALTSGLRAARLRRYAGNARRLEQRAVAASAALLTVCDADDEALRRGVPAHRQPWSAVVPNAVDPDAYGDLGPRATDPTVVFPASLGYGPNVDGAVWLADEVWPLVLRGCPEARLLLVGRAPAPEVVDLDGRPGIAVHGDVADMGEWLGRANVVAVPLRYGTGTRLKALEALAARRPVVGTTIGLAGLGLVDGEHALVADDPASFAAAILRLIAPDDTLGARLAAAGRAHVEAGFTWRAVTDELLDALDHAAAVGPR